MTTRPLSSSINLSSAKRALKAADGQYYDYYAAYSSAFVADILEHFNLTADDRILDPWNGSGTTTKVAGSRGLCAVGYDKNPVMTVVAKAGLADANAIVQSIGAQCQAIVEEALDLPDIWSQACLRNDALYWWFSPPTIVYWRKLEWALQRQLIYRNQRDTYQPVAEWANPDDISPLAAFFYVAAFRAVRSHLTVSHFASSNPTWIKIARRGQWRLYVEQEEVLQSFRESVDSLKQRLLSSFNREEHLDVAIETRCSTHLPLPDESISAVITSPPYCTRIDYAVATRPELAFFGFTKTLFDNLRRQMMGTTTVAEMSPKIIEEWGKTCLQTLAQIENHHTVASSTYYIKNIAQYFDALFRSMMEIDRVLVAGGQCGFVVQDSHYKDVHIDLSHIVEEMALALNWQIIGRSTYKVVNNFGSINNRSKRYRATSYATECAVVLQKK